MIAVAALNQSSDQRYDLQSTNSRHWPFLDFRGGPGPASGKQGCPHQDLECAGARGWGEAVTCGPSCPSTISEWVRPPAGDSSDCSHSSRLSASEMILQTGLQTQGPRPSRSLWEPQPRVHARARCTPQTVPGCPEPTCSRPERSMRRAPSKPWTVSKFRFLQ